MQPTDATGLGQRVRNLRLARGWTQRTLAARLDCVAQQSIDQVERGRIGRPRYLPELAMAFDCDLGWLLTGETKPIDRDRLAAAILAAEATLSRRTRPWSVERFAEITACVYARATAAGICTRETFEHLADAEIATQAAADAATGPFRRLWQRLCSGWPFRRGNPT